MKSGSIKIGAVCVAMGMLACSGERPRFLDDRRRASTGDRVAEPQAAGRRRAARPDGRRGDGGNATSGGDAAAQATMRGRGRFGSRSGRAVPVQRRRLRRRRLGGRRRGCGRRRGRRRATARVSVPLLPATTHGGGRRLGWGSRRAACPSTLDACTDGTVIDDGTDDGMLVASGRRLVPLDTIPQALEDWRSMPTTATPRRKAWSRSLRPPGGSPRGAPPMRPVSPRTAAEVATVQTALGVCIKAANWARARIRWGKRRSSPGARRPPRPARRPRGRRGLRA